MAEENKYKVVMLGEAGVGKTCIVSRYVKGDFQPTQASLGASFMSKDVTTKPPGMHEETKIKL